MNVRKTLMKVPWEYVLAAIVILLLPTIFSQKAFVTFLDFSNSGQIGDTIGGITAPFIGLASAYLIYMAFKVQVDANKIQSRNNEFGIALKLIDDLELKLNNKNNTYECLLGEGNISKVSEANFYEVIRFWNLMQTHRMAYIGIIVTMLRQIKYFQKFVLESKSLSTQDKVMLLQKASLSFGSNLQDPFESLLRTDISNLNEKEKQFYAYCKNFSDTTLDDLLFHMIDLKEFLGSDNH